MVPALLVAALTLQLGVGADLVFRLPEVLVRHTAAPRAVGTGGSSSSAVADPVSGGGEPVLQLSYEEFYVEHEVSTVDARAAAKKLNLDDVPSSPVGCGTCSSREVQYCEWAVLADHCCCERRFVPEPLPWLPHSCYAGAARCRPRARDCAAYARLRDCCCTRRLAERWKAIMASGERPAPRLLALSFLLLAAVVLM